MLWFVSEVDFISLLCDQNFILSLHFFKNYYLKVNYTFFIFLFYSYIVGNNLNWHMGIDICLIYNSRQIWIHVNISFVYINCIKNILIIDQTNYRTYYVLKIFSKTSPYVKNISIAKRQNMRSNVACTESLASIYFMWGW